MRHKPVLNSLIENVLSLMSAILEAWIPLSLVPTWRSNDCQIQ